MNNQMSMHDINATFYLFVLIPDLSNSIIDERAILFFVK